MSDDRTETFSIKRTLPGERLDKHLAEIYQAASRGTLQRLIEGGHILVNGQRVKPTHTPHAGEIVTLHWPTPRADKTEPEDIPLDILYEDDSLLVVNKPPGMATHPSAGHEEHTLVNALTHHCAGKLSGIAGVARPGIVHRLDLDTSGCLVVAKNDTTHLALQSQFKGRRVEKFYHAVVCGKLENASGCIEAPIARHPAQRTKMAVRNHGREAKSTFQLLQRLRGASFVEVQIHTGRTHQIRVHFQHIGHPVVGDLMYGKRQSAQLTAQTGYTAPRQLLHSRTLIFEHPQTGREIACHAPWPRDFKEALEALKIRPE